MNSGARSGHEHSRPPLARVSGESTSEMAQQHRGLVTTNAGGPPPPPPAPPPPPTALPLLGPPHCRVHVEAAPAAVVAAAASDHPTPILDAVHTLHVHVPTTISMSLRLDISTTTTTAGVHTPIGKTELSEAPLPSALAPVPPLSSSSLSSSAAVIVPVRSPSPAHPRKRKGGGPTSSSSGWGSGSSSHSKKAPSKDQDAGSSTSGWGPGSGPAAPGSGSGSGSGGGSGKRSRDLDREFHPPAPPQDPGLPPVHTGYNSGNTSTGSSSAPNSSGSRGKGPFEKLNTLKMLLDCGHLTPDEYHERKTQIINELTGTSTARKKPSPRPPRTLQPLMKTVVPHGPPDFGRLPKERAEKLSFDVDTLEWHATTTRVKLDLVPFATGQLRHAYFLQELLPAPQQHQHLDSTGSNSSSTSSTTATTIDGLGRLFVAKFSIRHAEPSSYLSDVEMQAVCAHYAALYNEHEPPLKVYYAQSWLLKLRDRGDLVCSVEEYLPGAYVKYSNNNGFVGRETSTTEERERNTPHAFSHFTFVASDYRLMVVDIQGVEDSYTDPQIHTADGRGFGAGNLGTYGMEKFLESHRCNEVCRWLGLRSINQQYKPGGTAAPQYQMPFGQCIKKSTSRITEERNTFSRSVTVSEAFGGSDLTLSTMGEEEPTAAVTTTAAMGSVLRSGSSSSVSTCATGSSSMLYAPSPALVDPMTYDTAKKLQHKHLRNPKGGVGGRGPMGLVPEEPSPLWAALGKLLCCCWAGA